MFKVRDLLRLSSVPLIGPHKIRALVSHFGDPASVLRATPRDLIRVPGIQRKIASTIVHHEEGEKFADEQLRRLNRIGGRIVTIWDPEYPDLLKKTYDPPALLYVLGHFRSTDKHAIALVGTRRPSQYGQMVAELFSRFLAELGLTVVSGLARGIDTIAHSTTLQSGGRTIAIIGSGLDVPYPPENRKLLDAIAQQGAVVSEFPMGAKPDATNFPRRNRIISGLSLGTVVVESGEEGGAMITASTALDQNREVFAVPGNITDKRSGGPNKLIREGRAKLVQRVEDILEELGPQVRHLMRTERVTEPPVELTLFEKNIMNVLNDQPLQIDTIAELAETSTADALVNLLSLEFKNLVRQLPGKMFVRL
ncbi:MAG: DNA-processing protein DprA [Ignavibacteriales bacterium]|nr:DNA-processing protein DprA [Ignavibacteriales bacterium]